ncbi:hypothetical protein GUJ93_ZPchr0013g34354 [Zizania palustris]|uniref:Uncharacterized protein n=1 Tax=Zizania palustris TaxID=103762 RepID=A0A8J6C232_ZIZPA|nr:hypothetical protein GUJ93_ZPchr0013g34354 [Zizania palustris]
MGEGLRELPADGVSGLCFSRHSDRLLVSSWDKTVRLYDAGSWRLRCHDDVHASGARDGLLLPRRLCGGSASVATAPCGDTISWVAMMPQLAVPTTPTPLCPR